jgi:hypothetical protein
MASMLNLFFSRSKTHSTSFLKVEREESMFLLLRKRHTLYEHRPGEIYTIGEIVSYVVLIPVNSKSHFGSVSSYDINEQR